MAPFLNLACMGRLEKLLPRRWRSKRQLSQPPAPASTAEDVAVEKLRKMVVIKNLQQMASAANSSDSVVAETPPPELVSSEGLLRENRNSLRRRREDTWHGPSDVPLPYIDCDVADEVDIPSSPLGTTSSVASSLPHLTRTGPELGSRESGYLSALSLSPVSCERLTPRALQKAKIRQTSQETITAKSEGCPSPPQMVLNKRKAVSQILPSEDDVDQFMRGWVYKTKYVTTVFEAKQGGLGDMIEDATEEIHRWLEKRRMLVAATEVHFSVPEEKRNRKDEQRLKTSLLSALVKNNQRILNLRRGRKLAPIQLVESRTEEKIDRENGCIQGVYLKAYGRLLRYSHWETPEWHSPYWKVPIGTVQPRPKHFLWSGDSETVQNTALIAVNLLVLTAHHVHSGAEATRLLRVNYTPPTRPEPYFPDGSPLYFRFKKLKSLGTIRAGIQDGGDVFYYFIPSCSPHTALFSLNSTSGELSHLGPEIPKVTRVELCVLASSEPLSETASLAYNRIKKNNIVVEIVTEHDAETSPELSAINNTIVTLDRKLSNGRVLVGGDELSFFYNFSVGAVTFLPSETVLPLTTAAPLSSLFTVDLRGIARPAPSLSTQPLGVYQVKVAAQPNTGESETLTQEFHLVPKTSRLRFVLDKQVIPTAKEFPAFEKELKTVIQKSGENALRLVLDQPRVSGGNMSRSSICFHAVGPDSLLSPQTTIATFSKIGDLFQVYNNFGVIDIAMSCEEPIIEEEPMSAALASPTSIFILSVLAFSTLFFFIIFVYFCFVRRYRDYLRAKEKALKGPPQIVPPTPTFVLTPPMAQPPMGYWE